MSSTKTKDAELIHLESDIQKIQVKTNMYINEYGKDGVFHLSREIIQNSIDEVIDPQSNGKNIYIKYDTDTDMFTCEDDGRSFNEEKYKMSVFCTTLQSGSKFFRGAGSDSSGEFGVGLTVVNALSEHFSMTANREYEKTTHTITFKEGKLVNDTILPNKKGKHGTIVSFKVNKKYMGNKAKLPIEKVVEWLEMMFCLNSENLKANNVSAVVEILKSGKKVSTTKIKPKPFSKLIESITPSSFTKDDFTKCITLSGTSSIVEPTKVLNQKEDGTSTIVMKDIKKSIRVDISMRYLTKEDTNNSSAECMSFCNYTHTIDNGTHVDAFDESFCRFMQKSTNDSLSEKQRDKLRISWDDCRSNLYFIISLSTNAHVGFVGNAKQKIQCELLLKPMKDIITDALTIYFEENKSILNSFINVVKTNAKSRLEAMKAKSGSKKSARMSNWDALTKSHYIKPNATGKQWKELFLVEGDSAGTGARNGCDPRTQGFFKFRGNVSNAFNKSMSDIMKNSEWLEFIDVIGTGIGENFDISKCYFNRFNIFTDADVDGFNISSGILAFFYKYLRPIVEAGMLYKVFTPLYSLYDKDHPYVTNKGELVDVYHKKITKQFKVRLMDEDTYMSKDELRTFLTDTIDYRNELILVAKSSGNINKFLIEYITGYMSVLSDDDSYEGFMKVLNDQKKITSMMSNIQDKYPEIKVTNDGRFYGVVEGKYTVIQLSPRFYKKLNYLINIYEKYGFELYVKDGDGDEKRMTIGQFLDYCIKIYPKIKARFKGLGELKGSELKQTSLDINHRFSVQYTVDDIERELEIFNTNHGDSAKDVLNRKKMMAEYKINRDDLDN